MSAVTDPIDAAIESAESLISSLLSRDHGVVQVDGGASESSSTEFTDDLLRSKFQDPEQSLFSPSLDHSLITEGSAPHFPALLTATSQATVPENLFLVSPKESLHALGS